MKTMKKIVAIMAVALMLCSILPLSVFAADAETIKYTISSYPAGTQYKAETHELDEYLTVITNTRCHFTSELRIYAPSGSVNGEVILASTREMTAVVLNAGNKASTLTVSTSPDNSTWTQHSTLSVASSYKDLSISNLPAGTKYVKLVNGSGQVRVKYITVSYAADVVPEEPEVPSTCEHDWVTEQTKAPDCTNAGENTLTCSKCGESKTETINALGHNYVEDIIDATCTATGSATYECSVCFDSYDEEIPMIPHNYVDGACDMCGAEEPATSEVTIDFSTTAQRVSFSTTQQVWQNGGLKLTNNKAGSSSNVADYSNPVRFYKSSTITIECAGMTSLVIAASGSNSDWDATLQNDNWTYTKTNDGYTITFAAPTDSITLTCAAQVRANSITAVVEKQAEPDCEHDYVGVETQAPSCTVEGVTTYTCSKCGESYTEAIATIPHDYAESIVDSTCTATGTATYTCSVCGDSYSEEISMKSHNYVDDVCADCGAVKAYKGTLVFDADKENRTEFSTQIQVWESNGLTFTNNKLSGNNIADYGAPVRIYKNSGIVIEFPEMSTLIIDASGIGNDYLWDATLEAAGLSFTVENKIYTITFAEPVNSIELTAANQVRANSITAIVAHEHTYDNAFDTDCNKCDEIRAVVAPIAKNGFSVSVDVSGLAVRFTATLEGMGIDGTTAIYDNAMLNGYKVISMGAIADNGVSTIDVPAVYLCDDDVSTGAQYAIRIKNIPADKYDVEITFTPYIIVEIDGEQVTIEGEAVTGTYNQYAG